MLSFSIGCFSMMRPRQLLISRHFFVKNLPFKKILWIVSIVIYFATITQVLSIKEKDYVTIRLGGMHLSYLGYFMYYSYSLYFLPLVFFLCKDKVLKILWFVGSLGVLVIAHEASVVLTFLLVIFFSTAIKKQGVFMSRNILYLLSIPFVLCFFLYISSYIKSHPRTPHPAFDAIYRRVFCLPSSNSYLALNFVKKENYYTRGQSSFYHLFTPFQKPKIKLDFIVFNLEGGQAPFDPHPVNCNAPLLTPVAIYADFGWLLSLLFAFFLGASLRLLDNTAIFFTSIHEMDYHLAVGYTCCILKAAYLLVCSCGYVLLSGGLLFYALIFIHQVNKRIYSTTS